MLELKEIVKDYETASTTVHALKKVSIKFRESEFVSILGHSGCGKTTLLNIIGGLDHYTSGDLIINGKSTKTYKDKDWDTYRNHSIGFVFQSYNLIPHQTVLSNVELALTLSGVSKSERRKRATEALERVGLGDQLDKKPNQMSGGQMQRVAIARALVNNPDILLADEPTGALDTATSVQIMELLKEIAQDKLVIMVTHNPELANTYSTRIIRLSDGVIKDDTNPFDGTQQEVDTVKVKKTSMSFFTALSLSLNNLMTKKGRTFLTAFAGSIGIIGIALILSLSNGIQEYIDKVQEDTLSSYPIQINAQTMDTTSLMEAMMGLEDDTAEHEEGRVYSNDLTGQMINTMLSEIETNNLYLFKKELETAGNEIAELASEIQYSYDVTPNIYVEDTSDGINQVNPNNVITEMMSYGGYNMDFSFQQDMSSMFGSSSMSFDSWQELISNEKMLNAQYEIVAGHWPQDKSQVVLIMDEHNEVSDLVLYSLGLKDRSQLKDVMSQLVKGDEIYTESLSFSYEDILNLKFRLLLPTDYYSYDEEQDCYVDRSGDEDYLKEQIANGLSLTVVGIVKPNSDAVLSSGMSGGGIGYTKELTEYIINSVNDSDIVKAQNADKTVDVFNGLKFDDGSQDAMSDDERAQAILEYFDTLDNLTKAQIYTEIAATPTQEDLDALVEQFYAQYSDRDSQIALLSAAFSEAMGQEVDSALIQQYMASMSEEEIDQTINQMIYAMAEEQFEKEMDAVTGELSPAEAAEYFDAQIANSDDETLAGYYDTYMPATLSDSTYDENIERMGVADLTQPASLLIYASSFDAKEQIEDLISAYNENCEAAGEPENAISYTDYVGLMMSSISTIINAISYVLIAFVAISLVVSSIMIGIITYISVLERTKEIGILRAIGASKHDISNVFNAEALIIGFVSGAIGIIITLLLNIPINAIICHLTEIKQVSRLPVAAAVILVLISMCLTFIAGLFPSRIAAKKDPVIALRSE
jgi:putative ABC transport system permease protein